jgi:hypothetical protein
MVVLMSGIVLVLFFVVAYFVVRGTAVDLLPGVEHTSHPHAALRLMEPPTRSA